MLNTFKLFITYFIILNSSQIIRSSEDIRMIYRELWFATPIHNTIPFKAKPSSYVIVHESGGPACTDFTGCSEVLRDLQIKDIPNHKDIRYNFLIGGDGNVYEGRGWYRQGSSISEYDFQSISIAFIGIYSGTNYLTEQAWFALKNLLKFAVEFRFLDEKYELLGHRQFNIFTTVFDIYQAECPGPNIYRLLASLSAWRNETIDIIR